MKLLVLRTCFTSSLLALTTIAQAHFDIFVTNLGTKTGIGGADVDEGEFNLTTRVFEGVLVANGAAPDYSRDEPGFFALTSAAPPSLFPSGASALPSNALASFSFNNFTVNGNNANLFHWDGVGAVDFQPVSAFSMALNPSTEMTSGTGALEFHPDFELDDAIGTPANGIYLVSVSAQVGNLDSSDPVYIVWLANSLITSDAIAEETEELIEMSLAFPEFEEAVDWVASNVAVPEPASVVLAILAVAGAVLVARKRM